MASTSKSVEIEASAEHVWRIAGGFGDFGKWMPVLQSCALQEGGRVRRLVAPDGSVIVERLLAFDEARMCLRYTFVESPDRVVDYVGYLNVEPISEHRSMVTWSGSFEPIGESDEAAIARYDGIYSFGLTSLKELAERAGQ